MSALRDIVAAAIAGHDATSAAVGMGGGPPLYRAALERDIEERVEPILARHQRELDEVRTQLEAARAGTGVEQLEERIAGLTERLNTAVGNSKMLRLALADSQAGWSARSAQWDADRSQLVDLVIAQVQVVAMLRGMPGRGEEPRLQLATERDPAITTVYVCGASAQIDRAERMIEQLRAMPWVRVSLDWPAMMRKERDADHTPPRFRDLVMLELASARDCDVLLFLHPEDCTTVTGWAELGAAMLGTPDHKPTILVSRWSTPAHCSYERMLETLLPLARASAKVTVADDELALQWLQSRRPA